MKVYIIWAKYENNGIDGVYLTKEIAEKRLEYLNKNRNKHLQEKPNDCIVEYDLITEEEVKTDYKD